MLCVCCVFRSNSMKTVAHTWQILVRKTTLYSSRNTTTNKTTSITQRFPPSWKWVYIYMSHVYGHQSADSAHCLSITESAEHGGETDQDAGGRLRAVLWDREETPAQHQQVFRCHQHSGEEHQWETGVCLCLCTHSFMYVSVMTVCLSVCLFRTRQRS